MEQQDYQNFEVIVVDQSDPFKASYYKDYSLDLQVVYQKEKALWLARNTAIKQAKGDYLLFFDDDSRVDADWIRQHLKCLDFLRFYIYIYIYIHKLRWAMVIPLVLLQVYKYQYIYIYIYIYR